MLPFHLEQDILDTLAQDVITLIASFDYPAQEAFDQSVSNAVENEIWDVADKGFPHDHLVEDAVGAYQVRDPQVRQELLSLVAGRARDEAFLAHIGARILSDRLLVKDLKSIVQIADKVLRQLNTIPCAP